MAEKGKEIAGTSTSKRKSDDNDKSVARKRHRSDLTGDEDEDEDDSDDEDEDDSDDEDEPPRGLPPPRFRYSGEVEVRIKPCNTMWAKGTILQFEEDLDRYRVRFLASDLATHAHGSEILSFCDDRIAWVLGCNLRPCQPLLVSITSEYFASWYEERMGRMQLEFRYAFGDEAREKCPWSKVQENVTFELGEEVEFYNGEGVWKLGIIAYEDIFWGTDMPLENIAYVCREFDAETGSQSEPELRVIRKRKKWENFAFMDY